MLVCGFVVCLFDFPVVVVLLFVVDVSVVVVLCASFVVDVF